MAAETERRGAGALAGRRASGARSPPGAWRSRRATAPPVPVVCVGNFIVGGAGKTPTAIALARMARGRGLKPGLLASGYGGRAKAPVVVDPSLHTADQVGDEALLLAAVAPTVVARDRAAGARQLVAEGVDIIIMDDGFQNPALAIDLSLVAVDAAVGIGNGRIDAVGPAARAADAAAPPRRRAPRHRRGRGRRPARSAPPPAPAAPRVRARLKPTRVKEWRKDPILAFAGIGHPEKFFATLAETRAPVARTLSFPDHYAYTEIDAEKLLAIADAEKLRLVTTEKDLVRLAGTTGALASSATALEPFHVYPRVREPDGDRRDDRRGGAQGRAGADARRAVTCARFRGSASAPPRRRHRPPAA